MKTVTLFPRDEMEAPDVVRIGFAWGAYWIGYAPEDRTTAAFWMVPGTYREEEDR